MDFQIVKMYRDKEVQNVNNFFVNVWRKNIFDIYVTEYGTALTTILPILFLYLNRLENCYRYLITVTCKNDQQTSPWKCLLKLDDQCRNYCPLKVIYSTFLFAICAISGYDKGNNKITELRTILQRESPNS
jgi:hypothetical protein